MRHKDLLHHPAKSLVKYTLTEAETYYPDLNDGSIFRIDASDYAVVIGTPKNPRDGQYMRLEIESAAATAVNFSTAFLVNGAVIADGTHTGNDVLVLECWYDDDQDAWIATVASVKAA